MNKQTLAVEEASTNYQMVAKNNRLRKGYKQTEVGVIPEDWEVVTFRQIVENNRLPSGIYKDKNLYGSGNKIIKLGDVFGYDYFLPDLAQRVELSKEEIKNYRVELGDIFIALASVKLEGVGKVMFVTKLDEDTSWDHNVALMRLIQGIDQKYIFYLFKSQMVRNLITSRATQVGTTFLKTSTILEFPIALPPKQYEQRAIATALSDIDALLAKLDQLIAKKRDLKQAAMQQLLTGQTRLPGFSGEWEVKRLGDVLEYEQPTKYLVKTVEYSDDNDVPVLTAGKTFILGYTNEFNGIFNNLPAIIFDDFTTAKKYVNFPFKAKSSAMKILKPRNQNVNLRLIYEVIQLIKFQLGDHKRYWISEYQNLEIKIPDSDEQTAIATILYDMDTEITALETRRDKTRDLKQGMMQELLTGRIRLI
jgi:type I restriction enzyme S subunit